MFSIFIISALFLGVNTYVNSLISNLEIENQEQYGSYYFALEKADEETYLTLANHPYVEKINTLSFYGTVNEYNIGFCEDFSLLPVSFLEGNYPTKENEIALEKDVLFEMRLPLEINQNVILDISYYDGSVLKKTYTVCGIYETSQNFVLKQIDILTAVQNQSASKSIFYTTSNGESLLQEEIVYENSSVIPDTFGQTADTYYAKTTLMNSISVIGFVLIIYTMNLIADTIYKDLSLLRMMGASKMQVVGIFYYQLGYITLLTCPLGMLFGIVISYLLTLYQQISFIFLINDFFYILILMLLTLFLGSIFPIVYATQASLGKTKQISSRIKKVKRMKKITLYGLTKRSMQSKRLNLIIFIIASSLCTNLMINRLTIIQQVLSSENETSLPTLTLNVVDLDYPMSVQLIDELSMLPGVENNRLSSMSGGYLPDVEVLLNINNIYDSQQETNVISRVKIIENATLSENEIMIYLPTYYIKEESDGTKTILTEQTSQSIPLKETRLNVGDEIIVDGESVKIVKILEDEDLAQYNLTAIPYTIFISQTFVNNHQLDLGYVSCQFEISQGTNLDYLTSQMYQLIRNTSFDVQIIQEDGVGIYRTASLVKQTFYVLMILIGIILLLFQSMHTTLTKRSYDLSLYQLMGMEVNQIKKLYFYEGLIISLCVVSLSFISKFFSQFISLLNFGDLSNFNFYASIPKNTLPLYFMTYLTLSIVILGIYYSTCSRILNVDKLERLRQGT